MVIGDSLPQGCRSLTVKSDYCAQSWPARLASSQGWQFVPPDFPRPVLFDLEQEVRNFDTLTLSLEHLRFQGITARFRQNLGEWLLNAVESSASCFDNLAVSGAMIHDAFSRTAATCAAEIAQLTPQGAQTPIPRSRIRDLHVAIDGRFVLNPSQDPAFAGFTALDWVRERKPEVLVVQCGHNHGLYSIGADADVVPVDGADPERPELGSYWDQWGTLADRLAQLPAEIGTILVCLLPKVGAVANLAPQGANRTDGYADTYEPVFSVSTSVLSGTDLKAVDDSILAINTRMKQIVLDAATTAGTAARVKFLDVFSVFGGLDFKNSLDGAMRVDVGNGVVIDNNYLRSSPNIPPPFGPGGTRIVAGGDESIDGMHLSGCGYALLASEAMNVLGLEHVRQDLLQQGFSDDSLLSRSPIELTILVRLLAGLRDVIRHNHFVPAIQTFVSEDLTVISAINMMHSLFKP